MNTNSRPQTPLIKDWLKAATTRLQDADINSAKLDSELILAEVLGKGRTYLHGHDDELIGQKNLQTAASYLERRQRREPLAYILGYKEFYGHRFIVTPDTLIPRPESEDIIAILKQLLPPTTYHLPPTKLVDVGTGSGCLGITAKLIFPRFEVTMTDISSSALKVAAKNAQKLNARIKIIKSNLLKNYHETADIIIANLPYVDEIWERSRETEFEPSLALFAADRGLDLIKKLIRESAKKLNPGGYLILEADPRQHDEIIEYAFKKSFDNTGQNGYTLVFRSNPRSQYWHH